MTTADNNNVSYEQNNNKFNFRVAGIVMDAGRVLLHTTEQDDFWNLPGGRVKLNETTEAAIVREMMEELGVHVEAERLAYVSEDFFEYDGLKYHEVGFYYVITLPEAHKLYSETEFKGLEDNGKLTFQWFSLDELEQMEVYPVFLKKELTNLFDAKGIKHFISEIEE
ncbi:NUDIX hydrolase [Paenibacillus xylanexedens]|uniref:ADP-ribose pyrophosphatase YjhB (NUDIX family) n=1 Tax=Paenibacillus xylanexedens TaxID=528191 RepID=A0ABS4RPA7_PAEXY|nr:NUDIX hydrolase [Paenibacillus xylanexedens]MBP2244200.1 ADP-ribose pyrophosphatase YjhB (NUDIX family) [Paenibacillus xylanexedens]